MLSLKTETDVLREVAQSVRARRMMLRWRQEDLATRSGVSLATLRRFERSGQISFLGLAKLFVSLGFADALLAAMKFPEPIPKSIDAFLAPTKIRQPQQRVRIRKSSSA